MDMEENLNKDNLKDNGMDLNLESEKENMGQSTQDQSFNDANGDDSTRQGEIEKLQNEVQELKEKFLRQAAEFDNFRKRTARERVELVQTAGKDVIQSLLEVLDDCDRAEIQLKESKDVESLREGVYLVFNKLRNLLHARGLKPMESIGEEFNPDLHEAITSIPAPSEDRKGKVVDELEKGYLLNDKIIRFAKVVVGK